MNFLKIAGRDISSIFKNRFIRVSVIAIIIVPLLYSLLYLAAFWDPYSRLQDLPVAVVNLDKGGTKDGKDVNYGSDFVDKLKNNPKVGWRFVSKDDAESGIKGKKYYCEFIIPEDFSTKVLSAQNGKPEQPKIIYSANEKKNFLAAQIDGKLEVQLQQEVAKNITDEYTKATFDSLYDVKDGFKQASDGSDKLKNGLSDAKDGSKKMADGTLQLNDKIPALSSGVSQLTDGASQLESGVNSTLVDKNGKPLGLKNGINQLFSGLNTAKSGTVSLDNGASQLLDGTKQVAAGVSGLDTAVSKGSNGNPSLIAALQSIWSGITNPNPQKGLAAGIQSLNTAVNTDVDAAHISLVTAVSGIYDGITNSDMTKGLAAAISNVNNGVANQLAPAVTQLNNGVNGKNQLKDGATLLYNNVANPSNTQNLGNAISGLNESVNGSSNSTLSKGAQGAYFALNHQSADPTQNGIGANLKALQSIIDAQAQANPSDPTLSQERAIVDGLTAQTTTSAVINGQPSFKMMIDGIENGVNGTGNMSADPTKIAPTATIDVHSNNLAYGAATLNTAVNLGVKDANGNVIQPSLVGGISSIFDGITGKLSNNKNNLSDGMMALNAAVTGVNGVNPMTGQPSLTAAVSGMNAAVTGVNGVNPLTGKPSLVSAVTQLKGGVVNQLSPAVNSLNNAVNVGSNSQPSLKAGINSMYQQATDSKNGLGVGVAMLDSALNKGVNGKPSLVSGAQSLKDGTSTLALGVSQLSDGSNDAVNGVDKLSDGTVQLKNGLNALNGNVPALASGVSNLKDGSAALFDGVTKLSDGANELSSKLKDGSDKINKNLVNDSTTMAKFVSNPVEMDEQRINPVNNYGTGFTPYFVPLSLWVGAIMMFFVISEKVDDDIKGSNASVVAGKYISYAFVGTLQAVLVSVAVMLLGFKPDSIVAFFGFNIFMSFVFIAIIQSLIFILGMAGRLLSIVLLILQLTSSGGTFPMELVPKFFKVLNPLFPFTYCTSALREITVGTDYGIVSKDVIVLACMMFVFLAISVIMKGHADKVHRIIVERKNNSLNIA